MGSSSIYYYTFLQKLLICNIDKKIEKYIFNEINFSNS